MKVIESVARTNVTQQNNQNRNRKSHRTQIWRGMVFEFRCEHKLVNGKLRMKIE